jgi:hypothetical protein
VGRAGFFGLWSGSGFILWDRVFMGIKILLSKAGLSWGLGSGFTR